LRSFSGKFRRNLDPSVHDCACNEGDFPKSIPQSRRDGMH
jgi:hypothetical protein